MKYVYRLYQWLIAAPIILVTTIVVAIVTTLGSVVDSEWWGYYPTKLWARVWCIVLLVRVEVRNRHLINKGTPYVFVANHQGAFDIFAISGYLAHTFKWMMRKGLTNIPLVGLACRAAGHIMVDTGTQTGVKRTMADAERKLQNGVSLVVFPEGRRTDDGLMGHFKPGAFRLATEFNMPVVPLTIDGSYRVMPRNTFNVTPGRIVITIHAPIAPGDEGYDDVHTLCNQCRDTIAASLNQP